MIVITMAGLSSRFFNSGYSIPKYALPLWGRSVFDWALGSFSAYFNKEDFLFVTRADTDAVKFVEKSARKLGINNFTIHSLKEDSRGQAETAYIALKDMSSDFPILIFNIDTIRYGYQFPSFCDHCDGYIEVFNGDGEHWSFVYPGEDGRVVRTTEKQRISNLCSDGLYYFRSRSVFCSLFESAEKLNETVKNEYYIAPLYNRMIMNGGVVLYDEISINDIDFCGTPDEYNNLLKKGGE